MGMVDVETLQFDKAGDFIAERQPEDLSWLSRAFEGLPVGTLDEDVWPLDTDIPVGRYNIDTVHGVKYAQKWIPVYAKIEGESVAEVISKLGGSYTPPQIGWRVERREIHDECHCKAAKLTRTHGRWVHLDGCLRAVPLPSSEPLSEADLDKIQSIQQAPDDTYLNGLYPTLGGRDARDPRSWITHGRSEYRERTKGMITWGSEKTDKPGWTGNTLPHLERIQAENKAKRDEQLREKVERWSKKQAPRKLGEL